MPKLAALDLPEGNLYDEAAFSEKDYGAPALFPKPLTLWCARLQRICGGRWV